MVSSVPSEHPEMVCGSTGCSDGREETINTTFTESLTFQQKYLSERFPGNGNGRKYTVYCQT
jgi:hypothetical protein